MKRIMVPQGCRSDIGLSDPIIKKLKDYFIVDNPGLIPQDYGGSYSHVEKCLDSIPYDFVLIVGDRVEMAAAATAAFMAKVKIGHVYAGIINDPITTYDDVLRHTITLQSSVQFCESEEAHRQTCYLMASAGLHESLNSHVVGITHFDGDLEVDESKVPKYPQFQNPNYDIVEPYDLVLLNSEPLSDKDLKYPDTINAIIQIGGNPDGIMAKLKNAYYYPNLPRSQFLGLLKNCQRFITNSSCGVYEAPHFLPADRIIMIGDRNRNRPRGPFKTRASDRIVSILREYLK